MPRGTTPEAHRAYMREYSRRPEVAARYKAYNKERQPLASARQRIQLLKRKYGLTPEQFQEMSDAQGGVCAICLRPPWGRSKKYLCVDHNHRTGKVRGLLCNSCNFAIGHLQDDPDLLERTITYLKKGS